VRRVLNALVLLAMLSASPAVFAHAQSSFNLRMVHFEHSSTGTTAYYRISLPLVVGDIVGDPRKSSAYKPAPFTITRVESGQLFHYVDIAAVRAEAMRLGEMIAASHRLHIDGEPIIPKVLAVRVQPKGFVPPFATLAEREAAVFGPAWPEGADSIDAGYVLVDAKLFYPHRRDANSFGFASRLRAGSLGEPVTRNLLIDHRAGQTVIYSPSGDTFDSITINPSVLASAKTFFIDGAQHISGGLDHLLFVLCLVLAAPHARALMWAVTGFTAGHSISLAAGFFGYAPSANWFSPLIEAAIAASILIAALAVLWKRQAVPVTFVVTVAIGVLHGFGFAFGLRELLGPDGPNPITSLVGFNLGVEAGQLAVALAVVALLRFADRRLAKTAQWARSGSAAAAGLVACIWLMQRVPALLQAAA